MVSIVEPMNCQGYEYHQSGELVEKKGGFERGSDPQLQQEKKRREKEKEKEKGLKKRVLKGLPPISCNMRRSGKDS